MSEYVRSGDLCSLLHGDIYGKLISIIDNDTKEEYNEYDIITGHGDLNSNVSLKIKTLIDKNL